MAMKNTHKNASFLGCWLPDFYIPGSFYNCPFLRQLLSGFVKA
jgi:hypothetical protein